ncbi:MAG TPA: hypothetical protein VF181_12030 [Balneolaceae bacterium]
MRSLHSVRKTRTPVEMTPVIVGNEERLESINQPCHVERNLDTFYRGEVETSHPF